MGAPETPRDDSYSSRKLVFSFFTSLLITVLGLASAKWPSIGSQLPTVGGLLLAVLVAYTGGNVSTAWVKGKTATCDLDHVEDEVESKTITKGSPADQDGEPEHESE